MHVYRPINSEGVVLALLRLTPHFFTLPILLNSAVPFAGVWGREGAVNAGVTALPPSAEEASVGVFFSPRRVICRAGSKVLGSASPSSENEHLFLLESEGPAERVVPRRVSLALMLLPRNEASSNVP
jgi:hypothetical protein